MNELSSSKVEDVTFKHKELGEFFKISDKSVYRSRRLTSSGRMFHDEEL